MLKIVLISLHLCREINFSVVVQINGEAQLINMLILFNNNNNNINNAQFLTHHMSS